MRSLVDLIIPSMDNLNQLHQCLTSLINTRHSEYMFHIYVVNNGHPQSCDFIDPKHKFITVLQPGTNLGWEGALKLGLSKSKANFVGFLNDDIFLPTASKGWLETLLQHFKDPKVAMTGPSSNMVMGLQNMIAQTDASVFTTEFLIGFCMIVRRSALEEVGGIDDTLPGGDDIDLSIRLIDKGYKLIVDKRVFVFHYGSQTGIRLYGDYQKNGGWNSEAFTEKTNLALIKKHGFARWWRYQQGIMKPPAIEYSFKKDSEGELIREKVNVKGLKVIDVGCGNLKTWPHAIGLDIIPKGQIVEQIGGDAPSQADIACDVSQPLPLEDESVDVVVARHILEHLLEPITMLRNWKKVLKIGGKLIISVPNEHLIKSIPMNPEHLIAFTPESFRVWMEAAGGLKILDQWDGENGISFTTLMERIS